MNTQMPLCNTHFIAFMEQFLPNWNILYRRKEVSEIQELNNVQDREVWNVIASQGPSPRL